MRIDFQLAALDHSLGFDWPGAMAWMAQHRVLNLTALAAYSSMLPQVALLTIALAMKEPQRVYCFLLAVSLSALACIAIWSFCPSFGAFSVYSPPPGMLLALGQDYAHELVRLLREGPGLISPRDTKGLIGFPSYHAVLALLVAWHARKIAFLRWPAFLLNAAVLLATPIQGGHHLVDVLAAFPVAAIVLFIAEMTAKQATLVNKAPKFTLGAVSEGVFRIILKQKDQHEPVALKPKLSGFS
ncbi:MAG TPA: phosphatase PAP2 family protein [Rhizomicrobium sp.]|nr:phosphatase PAP2 family protein [Rhizomicrobium sp.]